MKAIKNIKNLQNEISALPKYYHSHLWITSPASDGHSYLGISEFAKRYFVRIYRPNMDGFTKTHYGMANRFYIEAFINETRDRKQQGELNMSEKMEWERFTLKKNEPFVLLQTIQFDIQLLAPLDMRVIDYQLDADLQGNYLNAPYYFEVQALEPLQLANLMSEKQYEKSRKMFMY